MTVDWEQWGIFDLEVYQTEYTGHNEEHRRRAACRRLPQRAHSRSVSSEKDTKKERKFGAASQRNGMSFVDEYLIFANET
ncbi:hypothetical protein VF14_34225 [Nostoc linckia z18]|uniref:Uncharacterized protein n=2 Tax=Nostoc linckia TaxID=92942 RepID=A0A9Q6EI03_NOSLI|nr:hypothetical protein [Nostoc linckia]PHJ93028.1 hypothetical protein VF04_27255 [Nostoc linckia z7]PHJ93840.1 hypothetical protein VF08_34745 [Nostoc linckia z8]PHK01059.1 hypothetical protein VF09_33415 [Nostoc linckia z9]PHK28429.1 hypothetical protein VF14_34225 [Nostoc linckia z18]PHJ59800.1 hypothetical protein VF02_23790 [Nostoc linckia z1]